MSFPPPSVPQESPATPTKIKPGKGWYWLGALLLAGGLLGGLALAVAGFLSLKNTVDDFGRFKVTNGQGSATVSFEKPGTYTIYYESHSKVCQDLTQSGSGCTTETVRGPKSPPAGLSITISKDGQDLDVKRGQELLRLHPRRLHREGRGQRQGRRARRLQHGGADPAGG